VPLLAVIISFPKSYSTRWKGVALKSLACGYLYSSEI
jgi:hypothetical protein